MIKSSADIRQSFLDFFRSKKHSIVPSSSLQPDSPNLPFTNAGMNQFVPIFLGQRAPDVSKWAGVIPGSDTRAADTQKCIRAGGKHNDLEDVGLDTYHHTFFEMLGNWSFGDYFKREAIDWAWELVAEKWKFPPARLYATVYCPDQCRNEWPTYFDCSLDLAKRGVHQYTPPSLPPGNQRGLEDSIDGEALFRWAKVLLNAGLTEDEVRFHIVPGNKKDNFWMMGDTGPCGPCSEIHVDLTPNGDTKGSLVNKGDARCIEIWNLVFIQFNANPDGSFSPLPAKHVDTGMGFERVTGIIQNTNGFKDFSRIISNYETDIFRPLFNKIEGLSKKKYCSTLPTGKRLVNEKEIPTAANEQEATDVAFRVIADHIRTLSFAIADGIQPGIKGRNGVLRSIHKRMVRYASTIGIKNDLLLKTQDALIDTLATKMGSVFPEIPAQRQHIKEVLHQEADIFNKTLERGIELFLQACSQLAAEKSLNAQAQADAVQIGKGAKSIPTQDTVIDGRIAFKLFDTYGFPLDLTELMARERGLTVDKTGFDQLMAEQKKRSQDARVNQVIELSQINTTTRTQFVGYESLESQAKVLETVGIQDKTAVILDSSPLYAEMGGQVGDTGEIIGNGQLWHIGNTQKAGNAWLHFLASEDHASRITHHANAPIDTPSVGSTVTLSVDRPRRHAIERHHTVTHLLHWALHEVVSKDAVQKGSYVGPEKLTFDFSSAPLTPDQIAKVEELVNQRILENAGVSWTEVPYSEVKSRKDIMQFFGEKYGDKVRVVQIGGKPTALDGYSMELCGGTHTRATGEIGLFRIVAESATGAGIRRIEAVAGLEAYKQANEQLQLIKNLAGKINTPVTELEKKVESLLAQQKDLEKQLKAAQQKQAAETARTLTAKAQTIGSTRAIIEKVTPADGDYLQSIADSLKGQFNGVVVLGGSTNGSVALVATVSPDLTKQIQAGKIIQTIAPIVGGKGGGRPDNARGGGKEVAKLDEALAKAKSLLG